MWEELLRRRWLDRITPGSVLEMHVVHPGPPFADPMVAAHVILIQQPRDDWVTSL